MILHDIAWPEILKTLAETKLKTLDEKKKAANILVLITALTSLVAQTVKRLSTMQETRVQSLGWEDPLEKEKAIHSSTIAWKIPWTQEPGRLQSMGSQRVRHDWATSLSLFTFLHWRRKWQPTAVFLPGESQGRGSLVGCRLWGCTESDTTEET